MTGGVVIDGPLGEVDAALAAYGKAGKADGGIGENDVETICALGLHRVDLVGTRLPVPAEVVEGWARLGDWDAVERLLHQAGSDQGLVQALLAASTAPGAPASLAAQAERLSSPALRASVLMALAEQVAVHDPEAGRRLLLQVAQLAETAGATPESSATLTGLVAALWAEGTDDAEARAAADTLEARITGSLAQAQALAITASALRDRDPVAARTALAEAEQLALAVTDPATRAQAVLVVAGALVVDDTAAPTRLLRQAEDDLTLIEDVTPRHQLVAGLVGVWARTGQVATDPVTLASVEELAEQVDEPLLRDRARTDLVVALAEAAGATRTSAPAGAPGHRPSLERAGALAERIGAPALLGEARTALAAAWVTAASAASGDDGVMAASAVAGSIADPEWRARAYIAVAAAVVGYRPEVASEAFARAHGAVDRMSDPPAQSRSLARLASTYVGRDDDTARRLLERAEHVVGHVASPFAVADVAAQVTMALAFQAATLGEAIDAAEQIAERISDPAARDRARASVVTGLLMLAADPRAVDRAEAVAERIADPESRQDAQVSLVEAAAKADGGGLAAADRAEPLANQITDPARRGRALHGIATQLVAEASMALTMSGRVTLPDLQLPPGFEDMPGIGGPVDLQAIPGMPDLSGIPGLADLPPLPPVPGAPDGPDGPAVPGAPPVPGAPVAQTGSGVVGGEVDEQAAALMDRAEQLIGRIADPSQRSTAYAAAGATLAGIDWAGASRFFDRAVATAGEIRAPQVACAALVTIATSAKTADAARARALLATAQQRLDEIESPSDRGPAAEVLAIALAETTEAGNFEDMALVRKLLDDVGRVSSRCQVLGQLATAWAPVDGARAGLLLDRAVYEATHADDSLDRDLAITMIVASQVSRFADPGVVEIVEKLVDVAAPAARVQSLQMISSWLGMVDRAGADALLARAEGEADQVTDPAGRAQALASMASAYSMSALLAATPPPGLAPEALAEWVQSPPSTFPTDAWRLLAKAARDPGFGEVELLTTVVRLGGLPTIRIVTDDALNALQSP